jgi:hypothetical protein
VKSFLRAVSKLPEIAPRTIFFDTDRTHYYSEAQAKALTAEERGALKSRVLDEHFYYNTRYGTPLAYARPLDLLAAAGFRPGTHRILDFGYGGIGQLRLLGSLGADVVGVEVDPLTQAFYSAPSDQGPVPGYKGKGGTIRLVHGKFPAEDPVRESVGTGYDLFIAKNVLKRGYIHPEQPVPERQRIDLESTTLLSSSRFSRPSPPAAASWSTTSVPLRSARQALHPWADGRSPFPAARSGRGRLPRRGVRQDDSAAARAMAHALGWDAGEQPMDLQKDLFAHYTLVEKPASRNEL